MTEWFEEDEVFIDSEEEERNFTVPDLIVKKSLSVGEEIIEIMEEEISDSSTEGEINEDENDEKQNLTLKPSF